MRGLSGQFFPFPKFDPAVLFEFFLLPTQQSPAHIFGVNAQSFADRFKRKNPIAVYFRDLLLGFSKKPLVFFALGHDIVTKSIDAIF